MPTPLLGARCLATPSSARRTAEDGDWVRATLRRPAQLPPKTKEPDHFDLMVQYADERQQREDQAKLERRRAQVASFRDGLETQLAERQQRREAEEAEKQKWVRVVQGHTEELQGSRGEAPKWPTHTDPKPTPKRPKATPN